MDAKETARSSFERLTLERDLAVCDELLSDDDVDHDAPPGTPPGAAATRVFVGALLEHHPDLRIEMADLSGEGDRVALRLRWHAPETGYQQHGIVLLRVDAGGRIAERWSAYMPA